LFNHSDWDNGNKKGIVSRMQDVTREIDITSDICPMTFVRTRLALDKMAPGETLLVKLKGEEPLRNVPRTATEQGHQVLFQETDSNGISRLLIRRGK
jgi:tRNA 2-thiouridine synthesizing protein A